MTKLMKKQLKEARTCSCGYVGTDFSPKATRCRKCVSKSNAKKNPINNKRAHEYQLKKYPAPKKSVYGWKLKRTGEIVYVGESERTSFRAYEHRQGHRSFRRKTELASLTTREFDKMFEFVVLEDCTEMNAMKRKLREDFYIMKYLPIYNKIPKRLLSNE